MLQFVRVYISNVEKCQVRIKCLDLQSEFTKRNINEVTVEDLCDFYLIYQAEVKVCHKKSGELLNFQLVVTYVHFVK